MPGKFIFGTGSQKSKLTKPLSAGPSWALSAVACRPTMAPPIIFGLKPISLMERTRPTESGG